MKFFMFLIFIISLGIILGIVGTIVIGGIIALLIDLATLLMINFFWTAIVLVVASLSGIISLVLASISS